MKEFEKYVIYAEFIRIHLLLTVNNSIKSSNLNAHQLNNFGTAFRGKILHTFIIHHAILLASERSERDTLRSVQLRIVDIGECGSTLYM